MPYFFVFVLYLILVPNIIASNIASSALFIPKVMEYTTSYKTNDACRIGIVYTPDTIQEAILLKKNMQYKTLPHRKLIVKLIAYKQFNQRKAVSLDAIYLFTLDNQILKNAYKEDVIVFGANKADLAQGALLYIGSNQEPNLMLNTKRLNQINRSFSSAFLKFVEPYRG